MSVTLHISHPLLRHLHLATSGRSTKQPAGRCLGLLVLAWALGLAALLGLLPAAQAQVGTWATAGTLTDGRVAHTATLLNNGDVLVVGGEDRAPADVSGVLVDTVELYSQLGNSWSTLAGTFLARKKHTATRLGNGDVLVAGGTASSGATSSAQLFTPVMVSWQNVGNVITARTGHTATLLGDGTVLVVGGQTTGDTYGRSAQTALRCAEAAGPSQFADSSRPRPALQILFAHFWAPWQIAGALMPAPRSVCAAPSTG